MWLGASLVMAVLLFLWWHSPTIANFHHNMFKEVAANGSFGDTFGHINSLFSGAALLLVIISVFIQGKELKQVSGTFKKDSFERTFFNMIQLFNQRREGISEKTKAVVGDDIRGTKCIENIHARFELITLKQARMIYEKHYDRGYNDDLDSYFDARKGEGVMQEPLSKHYDEHNSRNMHQICGALNKEFNSQDNVDQFIQLIVTLFAFVLMEVDGISNDDVERRVNLYRYSHIFWGLLSKDEIELVMIYACIRSDFDLFNEYAHLMPNHETTSRIYRKYPFVRKVMLGELAK
jgi:hypothetical protein